MKFNENAFTEEDSSPKSALPGIVVHEKEKLFRFTVLTGKNVHFIEIPFDRMSTTISNLLVEAEMSIEMGRVLEALVNEGSSIPKTLKEAQQLFSIAKFNSLYATRLIEICESFGIDEKSPKDS